VNVLTARSIESARDGRWTDDPGFGVYLHIPFCLHRCHYCDFNTYEGKEHLQDEYVHALIEDIGRTEIPGRTATSVYVGGGTPTLLSPQKLGRLLDGVRDRVGLDPGAEVTVEANPETVDEASFEALMDVGFNRFSIGIQSLSDGVLAKLGRRHDSTVARSALQAARRAGAEDVNGDLIYGSPWEKEGDLQGSVEGILEAGCSHVSAYALTVEEGTPLHTMVATGRAPDVDLDTQADRAEIVDGLLEAAGFHRYEVSNWALEGRASAHNVLYWCAGDYLGLGAGAHGHLSGRRSWAVRRPEDFIAAVRSGASTEEGFEQLDSRARLREAVILGLRLLSGIDENALAARLGSDPELDEAFRSLIELGLLERAWGRIRATGRGLQLASEVARRLLP
jgi:putative oxygen-independent coproporphyrinogen III oxidase